jgi:hypothetical protein
MKDFFNEIRSGLKHELYYLVLFSSLSIPDICGAISSSDGEATTQKYKEWFTTYYPKKRTLGDLEIDTCITADICWDIRCSIFHRGSSRPKGFKPGRSKMIESLKIESLKDVLPSNISKQKEIKYSRIVFTLSDTLHCNVIGNQSDIYLNISLTKFCNDMLEGAEQWLQQNENTTNYQNNITRFLKYYPVENTFISGIPLLSND